jgi:hypothetical protein
MVFANLAKILAHAVRIAALVVMASASPGIQRIVVLALKTVEHVHPPLVETAYASLEKTGVIVVKIVRHVETANATLGMVRIVVRARKIVDLVALITHVLVVIH